MVWPRLHGRARLLGDAQRNLGRVAVELPTKTVDAKLRYARAVTELGGDARARVLIPLAPLDLGKVSGLLCKPTSLALVLAPGI